MDPRKKKRSKWRFIDRLLYKADVFFKGRGWGIVKGWIKLGAIALAVIAVFAAISHYVYPYAIGKINEHRQSKETEAPPEEPAVVIPSDSEPPLATGPLHSPEPPSYLPLWDLSYTEASEPQGGLVYYDDVKDNRGNAYTRGFGGSNADIDNYEVYKVDPAYITITGVVILDHESRNRKGITTFFSIYGDGELLYMSPLITKDCEPARFIVDISGVELLKIMVRGSLMVRVVDCFLIDKPVGEINNMPGARYEPQSKGEQ